VEKPIGVQKKKKKREGMKGRIQRSRMEGKEQIGGQRK
jgi:hypothetical protein